MSIEFKKIETVKVYMDLVEKLSYLTDNALKKLEKQVEEKDIWSASHFIPEVISLVNTIAYLRGDSAIFLEYRPDGLEEFQRDLYRNEDVFIARLYKLIEIISESEKDRKIYKNALKEYYINRNLPHEYRE